MAAGNVNYDTILSTTLANHMPKLIDNVFSARPLVYFLKQAGQIRTISGGNKIVLPLLYGSNSTAKSYSGYEALTITAQTGMTAAEYQWKQYAATIAISGIEEAKNNSEEQIIDLLEAKTFQAEETIAENFDKMFIQSSLTSNATGNDGKDWLGLAALVKDSTSTNIGGIDQTDVDNAWWRPYKNTTAGSLTLAQMRTAYNTIAQGNDQPNMILTTQTLFEKYEDLLQSQERFMDPKVLDGGFQNLLFKGAPIVFDTYVPTGDMYFLNTKYLRLVGHSDTWFKPTPFVRPRDVDARYAQILCYGELTISNRARQGVLTAKTA
jgi:hypothetical protein